MASRSPKCHQLLCKNKDTILQASVKRIQIISLPENRDYGFALSWLKRLYGGEDISDKELFSKDFFPPKAKNGFHKQEKKMSNEIDKMNKEKNVQPQNDNENMIAGRMLSDLMYLAERDLDNFGAPTFDYGDSLFDDFQEGLASYAGDTEEIKTKLQSNTSDRYIHLVNVVTHYKELCQFAFMHEKCLSFSSRFHFSNLLCHWRRNQCTGKNYNCIIFLDRTRFLSKGLCNNYQEGGP